MSVEFACIHHLYYLHTERILKAAEITTSSASSKVVS